MLKTRADLKIFPGFAELDTDTSGNPLVWQNRYECSECLDQWTDNWSCGCNDRCPSCDAETEPLETIWAGPQTFVLIALWGQLPEAV
jgi:hypothetical protein